jgi:hypothetical protein
MAITIPDITTIQDIITILALTIIATITTALITITITIVVIADGIIGTMRSARET